MRKFRNFKSKKLRRFILAMQNREYIGKLVIRDRMYLVKRRKGDKAGYCPSCESVVTINQRYCPQCGQRLDWRDSEKHRYFAKQVKDDNSIGVCRSCAEIIPFGVEKCPSCGCLVGWGWEASTHERKG